MCALRWVRKVRLTATEFLPTPAFWCLLGVWEELARLATADQRWSHSKITAVLRQPAQAERGPKVHLFGAVLGSRLAKQDPEVIQSDCGDGQMGLPQWWQAVSVTQGWELKLGLGGNCKTWEGSKLPGLSKLWETSDQLHQLQIDAMMALGLVASRWWGHCSRGKEGQGAGRTCLIPSALRSVSLPLPHSHTTTSTFCGEAEGVGGYLKD